MEAVQAFEADYGMPGLRRTRSSNDPTNQEVTSKSRDTPIHR